jgi:hypothetical protein
MLDKYMCFVATLSAVNDDDNDDAISQKQIQSLNR